MGIETLKNMVDVPPVMKDAPTRRGYVNFRELRRVVAWSNVGQFLLATVVLPVLQSHSQWLSEPWDKQLGPVFALLVALIGARIGGVTFLKRG